MLDEELYFSGVPELKNALLHSKEMCYDYNAPRRTGKEPPRMSETVLHRSVGAET